MELEFPSQAVLESLVKYLLQILGAVVIVIVGLIGASLAGRAAERSLKRTRIEAEVRGFLVKLAKLMVLAFTLLLALEKFGFHIAPFVAGLGVLGFAASQAVQGPLRNMAAGMAIILGRYYRVGDFIEVGGVRGVVRALKLSATVLQNTEDATVVIPNSKIGGEILTNFTSERRVDLMIGISHGEDIPRAITAVHEALGRSPRVLQQPPPVVGVIRVDDYAIHLSVRPWCKVTDYWATQFELNEAILAKFKERGITLPRRELPVVSLRSKAGAPGRPGGGEPDDLLGN